MGDLSDAIDEVTAWRRLEVADGVVLIAPDAGRRIRVRPRLPGRRLDALIDAQLVELGARATTSVARRRVVTDHGELGAVASVTARRGDAALELALAATGGDPLFVVDGVAAPGAGIAAMVEALAIACDPGLGAMRSRMFVYAAPAGWRGLRRDAASLWLHPAYPRVPSIITVHDARPFTTGAAEQLHRRLHLRVDDRSTEAPDAPVTVVSDGGLEGRLRTVRAAGGDGRPTIARAAAFGDNHFVYQATLTAPVDDAVGEAAFERVVRSFHPLPVAVERAPGGLDHWVD